MLWRITSATGVKAPDRFAPLVFADRWLATTEPVPAPGPNGDTGSACGLGGSVAFLPGAMLRIEAGFDTIACGDDDERPTITATLNQVTGAVLETSARVRLRGPAGEIVLEKR